jgi:hypothetical protein
MPPDWSTVFVDVAVPEPVIGEPIIVRYPKLSVVPPPAVSHFCF